MHSTVRFLCERHYALAVHNDFAFFLPASMIYKELSARFSHVALILAAMFKSSGLLCLRARFRLTSGHVIQ